MWSAMYATARDARTTSRTDIMFIETQPFEKNYTQSQQMGGGRRRRADQDENRISQRQKEIIAATWNEIRGGGKDKVNSAENAKFLAEVQTKLKEQAKSLADRARSRELAGANQEFQSFVKDMEAAAAEMDAGVRQAEGAGLERRARAGDKGAAAPAARRSDVPGHSSRVRKSGRRRRRRRRRPRPGQPVRPGARHRKESV